METNTNTWSVTGQVSQQAAPLAVKRGRGRGRPRKDAVVASSVVTNVVKRGRGRPRKNAEVAVVVTA